MGQTCKIYSTIKISYQKLLPKLEVVCESDKG